MPKKIRRMMNITLEKWHYWHTFIGVYCIFIPIHNLGIAANVRRYAASRGDYLVPLVR
jgi:cytochrome c oxidase subunit 1